MSKVTIAINEQQLTALAALGVSFEVSPSDEMNALIDTNKKLKENIQKLTDVFDALKYQVSKIEKIDISPNLMRKTKR